MNRKIAVLIPCYNEGKTIAKVVRDFKRTLPKATIYVYDNNSTDDTAKQAAAAGAVVKNEYRQGKGNVMRAMFRDIEADCYLMVDGDNTYPAGAAKKMCDAVLSSRADMAIGDRLSSSYFKENKRRFHGAGNRLVRALINLIFHSHIKDAMSGYRAFSRDFVKTYPVLAHGFEVETEMTIHALDKNFLVTEIPVEYRDRKDGDSKLRTLHDGTKVIRTIVALFEEHKPMLFFGTLAIIFILLSLALVIPVLVEYFETGLVPRFPTLIVAGFLAVLSLLMLVCGIILKVIVKKHREIFELNLLNLKK
ncbi:MAG: glycosyltransferase [Candidatus Saccharibacteria bacterium]|nr:glycosyltransferase [Candidatus Saccharibacteria bacterium]